jgi:hypothetical protein
MPVPGGGTEPPAAPLPVTATAPTEPPTAPPPVGPWQGPHAPPPSFVTMGLAGDLTPQHLVAPAVTLVLGWVVAVGITSRPPTCPSTSWRTGSSRPPCSWSRSSLQSHCCSPGERSTCRPSVRSPSRATSMPRPATPGSWWAWSPPVGRASPSASAWGSCDGPPARRPIATQRAGRGHAQYETGASGREPGREVILDAEEPVLRDRL